MTLPGPDAAREVQGEAMDRRGFFRRLLRGTAQAGAGAGLLFGIDELRHGRGAPFGTRGALGLVRPPGSIVEDDFLSLCMRCTRCADACEAQCIQFFGAEAGDLAATPYILPADRGCTLCLACGKACPTGAIKPLERMQDARMGVAVVDERLCVSHNGTGVCGACHTVCPLRNRAITQDFRNSPTVQAEACVGCGLCEEICIVRDRRAIRVTSDRIASEEPGEEAQR